MILGTIPDTLFQPLAAPGASIYTRILLDIFNRTRAYPDPLSREFIVELCYRHLSEPQALTLTTDAETEAETDNEDKLADRAGAIRICESSYTFFHWGDMDAGGFRILAYLRHNPMLADFAETTDRLLASGRKLEQETVSAATVLECVSS